MMFELVKNRNIIWGDLSISQREGKGEPHACNHWHHQSHSHHYHYHQCHSNQILQSSAPRVPGSQNSDQEKVAQLIPKYVEICHLEIQIETCKAICPNCSFLVPVMVDLNPLLMESSHKQNSIAQTSYFG